MNKLLKQDLIKAEDLDNGQYFQSLLREACRLNRITGADIENIQLQSIQLLARRTERFTRGESSSVRVETAQNILMSVYYSIGVYLKSLPDTDVCLAELKSKPLSEMYSEGNKIIEGQIQKAKRLYSAVKGNCIITDNAAYNATVKGLAVFFSSYDMHFDAHSSPANIDYPLSNDKMDLAGIEYFYNYLQTLFYENQFCQKFNTRHIHNVLRGYNENYKDLLVNIFEHVLINALGCVLVDKNARELNIEPPERERLQAKLKSLTEDELNGVLLGASEKLCGELDISNLFLRSHITEAAGSFAPELKKALELNKLESVFVSFKSDSPQIRFRDGKKMNDELFSFIAQEIRNCRTAEEKAAVIREKVHSLTDLTDILGCGYIYDGEFPVIFGMLQDGELALLMKKLPSYGLDAGFSLTGNEKEWETQLTGFFDGMEPARRNAIAEAAKHIKFD